MTKFSCSSAVQFFILGWGFASFADPCLSSETITAITMDGRHVTGQVDTRTNLDRLWIRHEEVNLELVSGFAWENIAEVRSDGKSLDRFELQAKAASSKPRNRRVELGNDPSPNIERTHFTVPVDPVKTLVIKASIAQWDEDPQTDGIRVWVMPLDAHGRLVPVDGQIELTLVIQNRSVIGSHGFAAAPGIHELDRISHNVRRDHFNAGPAVYDLPFSKLHPEFDTNIAPHALLNARMGVPGSGVFEASDAQLELREYSPFRDQLLLYSPQRYLRMEGGRPTLR